MMREILLAGKTKTTQFQVCLYELYTLKTIVALMYDLYDQSKS